jgi:glycyl-tRNA synthetase alpha chain
MAQVVTFQEMIRRLQAFWADRGCAIVPTYDIEMGAGTFHPETTLRCLGPAPCKRAYVQPSRRPQDGRYGQNPNRFYKHHQFQVIIKPSPGNAQDLALDSFRALGMDPAAHDMRFVEDNWESPTLGAAGLGFEVWAGGMEVLQFTYFQQMGGMALRPVTLELAYGLERIAVVLQDVDNAYDLVWTEGPPRVTYRDLFLKAEYFHSTYSFEQAAVEDLLARFRMAIREGGDIVKQGTYMPAYERCLHASHLFNVLDARGALGPAEKVAYVAEVRQLAKACFVAHLEVQS